MAKVAKEQYVDWKNHPVTKEVFANIADVASDEAAKLINRRQEDWSDDQYVRGFIRGIQEIIDWTPEFDDEL